MIRTITNLQHWQLIQYIPRNIFCFAVLCCCYTLTDFPISTRLTSLALWQSNDCPSTSIATLMNMDKYFMWIHYERLHNHNKAKHNKTVCIFLGIYCSYSRIGIPGSQHGQVITFIIKYGMKLRIHSQTSTVHALICSYEKTLHTIATLLETSYAPYSCQNMNATESQQKLRFGRFALRWNYTRPMLPKLIEACSPAKNRYPTQTKSLQNVAHNLIPREVMQT